MAFFENLGKKVGEAAQAAAKKSGEMVEVTKLNMSISTEEDKIKKLYVNMGKKVYESFCSGSEAAPEFTADCEAIKVHEQTIKDLKQKILDTKNIKACTGCGAEIEKTVVFCPKCGTKNENAAPAEQQASGMNCPSCGAEIKTGSEFCAGCGTKVSQ